MELEGMEVVINQSHPFILLCGNVANSCGNYIHLTAQCYSSHDRAYVCLFHCLNLQKSVCFFTS